MNATQNKDFLFEVEEVEHPELINYLAGYNQKFVRIGPKKYFLHQAYLREAANIYNFPLKSDDTFVVSFPKTGTTLTQELVWLIKNNLDFEKARSMNLTERFPFLDIFTFYGRFAVDQMDKVKKSLLPLTVEKIRNTPSPRFIKSHLPFSLLPPSLLDETKVVYVTRDPRDAAVSFYHHHKLMKLITPDKEFKPFWEFFHSDNMVWAPFFDHIIEAWEKRNHPNLLFLFYEEMIKDMPTAIRRVADFFDKTLTDEEVNQLADHLKIDNFRKNKSVNWEAMQKIGVLSKEGCFIREGKSGTWRDYFDEEMTAQAEEWIAKKLSETDFRFPHL